MNRTNNNKFIVLIPCAGYGSRFGMDIPKQYAKILNKTLLEYTLDVFLSIKQIHQIIIVANPNDSYIKRYETLSTRICIQYVGGETRALSVLNGLYKVSCSPDSWVLVHDAARCCITSNLILNLLKELQNDPVGGILAIPAIDTVKVVENNNIIKKTIPRNHIYLAQTPQMFRYQILFTALKSCINNCINKYNLTDEASAVETLGLPIKIVMGSCQNIKVTYPEDLQLAEFILSNRN